MAALDAQMSAAVQNGRNLTYVTSTHWDREWYQPFQHYRMRLVELFDRWLADRETGRIEGPFQTDGQWIPIEDYLEVRPHRREHIRYLVATEKIVPGPWYVQPDEFLPSGESLLRNLEEGHCCVREFGGNPSKAGLVADQFGHISQLPQIFAGFGIRAAFLWRGLPANVPSWFLWRGADGTTLPTHAFPGLGYVAFAALVRTGMDARRDKLVAREAMKALEEYFHHECSRSSLSQILLFDGADHFQIDFEVWHLIRNFAEQNGIQARHGSLDEYLEAALAGVEKIQTVLSGELREPGQNVDRIQQDAWLIPGIASSRMDLKLRNAECETLLCSWAEPFCALAGERVLGSGDFLRVAWRHLLQNHAHDSIGGCSVDQVHRDMHYRFDQAELIAEGLLARVLPALADGECGAPNSQGFDLVIFHPHPVHSEEPVQVTLRFPEDWPKFAEWFVPPERLPAFRIFDSGGHEVPYWRLAQREGCAWMQPLRQNFPLAGKAVEVDLVFRPVLPALGFARYRVLPGKAGDDLHYVEPTRHPSCPSLRTGLHSMENAILRVEVNPNGTLNLTDKRTGRLYPDLLTLESGGDFGDGWFFGKPQQDEISSSRGAHARISLVEDNPLRCAFRVQLCMQVPSGRSHEKSARGADLAMLRIDWTVRLAVDSPRLDLELKVDNVACDHRLRVLFPSMARTADTFLTDSAFDVIERKIELRSDNHKFREQQVETVPMQSWVACYSDGAGLAILAQGLREAAVLDFPDRPIALTLLRAVGRTFLTGGEPDGQLRGVLNYHMAILPLEDTPDRPALFREAARLASGVRSLQISASPPPGASTSHSFLTLEGEAVFSSLRQKPAGMEIRLFNPMEHPVTAKITFPDLLPIPSALLPVDFDLNSTGAPIAVKAGVVSIDFQPKQIRTFLFQNNLNPL